MTLHRQLLRILPWLVGGGGLALVAFSLTHQQSVVEPPLRTAAQVARPALAASPSVPGPTLAPLPHSPPVRLQIPAIHVDTRVNSIGLDPNGGLAVPSPGPGYDIPGWYRYSPTPGAVGPAVIAGHVDSAADGPSVFFRLGALRVHDRILVSLQDHHVVTFDVTSVGRYAKATFPSALVYADTAGPELRLITCGGAFDHHTGHYRDDIVITAELGV